MSAVLAGLGLGVGLILIASVWVGVPAAPSRRPAWVLAWQDRIVRADLPGMTPGRLAALSLAAGLVLLVTVYAWTQVAAVAVVIGLIVVPLPPMWVSSRARARARLMRQGWPDVIDSLVSGVRAGAGLPELLADLGESGPDPLRPAFRAFGTDYRAEGRFDTALDRLKERLADPVADRIVEALRLAREVGGSDLSVLLRDLGTLLREDARVRGELEARQSWTVNAARLAVVAPWAVLLMISSQPRAATVWNSPRGVVVLLVGAAMCVVAYLAMRALGRLSTDSRTLR
ncbi:type II secretion system F family protein [Actinomyces sp. B33]|uniref:type II secretion system F family protein n=1 Tax=Actinomyces sp. B33 TaxID=2942131 RepID=UPI002340E2D1|nr:type II secretion system F family protein [Actinomyces sp. B33]MDC4233798.1 type II secretion system F family protein [Actinomyces sp. B33]